MVLDEAIGRELSDTAGRVLQTLYILVFSVTLPMIFTIKPSDVVAVVEMESLFCKTEGLENFGMTGEF